MCELLGISASTPVDMHLSFARLAAHGRPGGQPDGWGAAFLQGGDAQIWRDPQAAVDSLFARHLAHEPITSPLAIAHIRFATAGNVALANTHPFARELFGRRHVFAHNGNLVGQALVVPGARFQPIGVTDSETTFCHMLAAIAAAGDAPGAAFAIFTETARRLRELGHCNLLYASGGRLLAHSDWREADDGSIGPGLWLLERHRHVAPPLPAEGAAPLHCGGKAERLALIASVPLTGEHWRALPRGTVVEIVGGEIANEVALGAG